MLKKSRNSPLLHGNRKSITIFAWIRHLSFSQARRILSPPDTIFSTSTSDRTTHNLQMKSAQALKYLSSMRKMSVSNLAPGTNCTDASRHYPQFIQPHDVRVPWNRPRPLPFTSAPNNHSLIIDSSTPYRMS